MKILLKNKTKTDCGLIAAFNASSWCNMYKSYREIEKAALSCGYNAEKGLYYFQFAALIKKLKLPAKKIQAKSIESIQSKIYMGKMFVFLYTPTGDHTGHAIVTFMDHRGYIRIINPEKQRITWGEFASDIYANGMKSFHVYEVPRRVTKNDESRAR